MKNIKLYSKHKWNLSRSDFNKETFSKGARHYLVKTQPLNIIDVKLLIGVDPYEDRR